MITGTAIRKNQYYDSVFLMGFNNRLSKMEGVKQTAVLMGSDANKEVLTDLGFMNLEIQSTTANDLVVGVIAESQPALDRVLDHIDEWLTEVNSSKVSSEIHTLLQAITAKPEANLVVISVPGEFAAHEARESLEAGKHVFLFSDNVSVQDEISLKQFARDSWTSCHGTRLWNQSDWRNRDRFCECCQAGRDRGNCGGRNRVAGIHLYGSQRGVWDFACHWDGWTGSIRCDWRSDDPVCVGCFRKRHLNQSYCHSIQTTWRKDFGKTGRADQDLPEAGHLLLPRHSTGGQ